MTGRAACRSSVPVRGQCLGECLRAALGGGGLDGVTVALGEGREAGAGERRDGGLAQLAAARALRDPAQRVGRELVVGLVEGVPAAVGEREDLGGAAAGAGAVDALLAGLDDVLRDEGVEVAADGRLGQLQPEGQLGRGGRTVVEDGARDAVARAPLFVVGRRGAGADRAALAGAGRSGPPAGRAAVPSWSSLAYFTTPLLRNSSGRYNPRPDHGQVASITKGHLIGRDAG